MYESALLSESIGTSPTKEHVAQATSSHPTSPWKCARQALVYARQVLEWSEVKPIDSFGTNPICAPRVVQLV